MLRFNSSKVASSVRSLNYNDLAEILRQEGIVLGNVVMSWPRFIMKCHLLGFDPVKAGRLFL